MCTFGTGLKNNNKKKQCIENTPLDFLGGAVDRNLPANCRGQGFDPWVDPVATGN